MSTINKARYIGEKISYEFVFADPIDICYR